MVATPVAARSSRPKAAWIVAAAVAVLALIGGGLALSQRTPTAKPIPSVGNDLPSQLKTDLNEFVQQVPK